MKLKSFFKNLFKIIKYPKKGEVIHYRTHNGEFIQLKEVLSLESCQSCFFKDGSPGLCNDKLLRDLNMPDCVFHRPLNVSVEYVKI